MCDTIDQSNSLLRYEGEYCQYDPRDCPVGRDDNGLLVPCSSEYNPQLYTPNCPFLSLEIVYTA